MTIKHLFYLILPCLLTHITGYTQQVPKFKFENHINEWQSEHKVPAVGIGIIENGEVIHAKVYGESRNGFDAPDDLIFDIASLTKPIVAITALNIIQNNGLTLDEPVYKYFVDNDIRNDPRHQKLTARNILSHQTGFVNWRNMSPSGKLIFNFIPGERFAYSGEGYEYLRRVLESKFKIGLENLCDSLLFRANGMDDTKFYWDGSFDESRVAIGYNDQGEAYDKGKRRNANAAAGVLTTITDYSRFIAFVLDGAGLSSELFNEMISSQVTVKNRIDYGLGWQIVHLANDKSALVHPGGEPGVRTVAVLLPEQKRGVVVFTNSDNGYLVYEKIISSYLPNGQEIFELMNKKAIPKTKYVVNKKDFDEYLGRYEIRNGLTIEILRVGDELKFKRPGAPLYDMYAQSKNDFILDEELSIEFIRNALNSIISIVIYQNGMKSYEGKKID